MAPKRRPDFSHTYHHIVIRGIDGMPIFDSDRKKETFLSLLRDVRQTHDLSLYAFDFTNNHTHQFIRRNGKPMARFYQQLKSRYTGWYNEEFNRSGTIYDGRYFNTLVDSEQYFHSVWSYVQLQGVKAGMFDRLADSPWSTAGLYLNQDDHHQWVDWKEALTELNVEETKLVRSLSEPSTHEWFDVEPPRSTVREQHFLAENEFIERYMQIRESEVREAPRVESPVSWETLVEMAETIHGTPRENFLRSTKKRTIHRIRCGLAYAGRTFGHLTTGELGDRLGCSESTVSRMIKRSRERFEDLREEWNVKIRETQNASSEQDIT